MGQRYLILDTEHNPVAQADLISKRGEEPLHLEVLADRVDRVEALGNICLIGMGDDDPAMMGDVIRSRGDRIVVQPTQRLGPEARQNLRVPIVFTSVMYPVKGGNWRGQKHFTGLDLSCGGIAFYADCQLELHEQAEIVVTPTEEPVILRCEILRKQELQNDRFLYATKFVDMCEDEEVVVREAVFSLQLQSRDAQN